MRLNLNNNTKLDLYTTNKFGGFVGFIVFAFSRENYSDDYIKIKRYCLCLFNKEFVCIMTKAI